MLTNIVTRELEKGILPAITFDSIKGVMDVVGCMFEAGITILEVPLRTSAALEAIKIIHRNFPEVVVGAGTILTVSQLKEAIQAGAMFGLSPGLNKHVVEAAACLKYPFIPGVMTPTELEYALSLSCRFVKLFPIEQMGGVKFIHALEGPYAHTGMRYIPMGGVNFSNMASYLSAPFVIAIGGSWVATQSLIAVSDFDKIRVNARQAVNAATIARANRNG